MFLADARIEPTPWRCVCGTAGLSRETAALAWLPGASGRLAEFWPYLNTTAFSRHE